MRGRGGRGGGRDRRDEGREYFNNGPPRDYEREYTPQHRKKVVDNRDQRDLDREHDRNRPERGRFQTRSNDDFYVRPPQRGRGGREPMDMHHGPPRYDYGPGYRYGPPPGRGGRFHQDEYYDDRGYGQ